MRKSVPPVPPKGEHRDSEQPQGTSASERNGPALAPHPDRTFGQFLRRKPKQSRSRALVQSIVQSLDEFLERGRNLDEVPLESLIGRAGVGIGSFYEYFSNKDGALGVLIGHTIKRDYDELLRALQEADHSSIDKVVVQVALVLSELNLVRPDRTRFLWIGILRLGLFPVVLGERDRFSRELAKHAASFFPHEDPEALAATMRTIADSAMGLVNSAVFRDPPTSVDACAREIEDLAMALIRARHPT